MTIDSLRRLLVFLVLILAQALVLSRIQLFHCATPLLYVYFIIILPRSYPRWAGLLWGFTMGLAIDMFANTPGVTAATLTLTAFIQPALLELFLPRDAEDNIKVSAATLGFWRFATLTTLLLAIHCLVFFALESFTFFSWAHWLQCSGASLLLTLMFILSLESLRK